jgi:hypothetical protein
VDKFLNIYDDPKLSQEYINHLNRFINGNEIEAAAISQKRKAQDLTDSLMNAI